MTDDSDSALDSVNAPACSPGVASYWVELAVRNLYIHLCAIIYTPSIYYDKCDIICTFSGE